MATSILTATVALVKIGRLEFEGLLLEDGRYAIAQQQIGSLFSILQKEVQIKLERLLGKPSKFYVLKVKTNRAQLEGKKSGKAENALLLHDFTEVIFELSCSGHAIAKTMNRALIGVSLEQFFADAFNKELTPKDRQEIANRILDTPSPWKRMYDPEFCKKAFSFFGAQFYWDFCYGWMNPEEICKVNALNPCVEGRRAKKIHQYLDEQIRERLTPYVTEMVVLMDVCNSAQEFLDLYSRRYGANQLSLQV